MNILYTCIVGSYDNLHEVKLEDGWRAICFTDTDIKSNSWEIIKIEKADKVFRDIKIRPFLWLPPHDKSVWIDGNLEIKIPLSQFVRNRNGFWLMTHPDRNCIYEEAIKCIELKKDNPDVIHEQIRKYVNRGYPANNGLWATGCLIRDNDGYNRLIADYWWAEVRDHSVRDQISFPFVRYMCAGIDVNSFPFLENIQYHYHVHRQKMKREKINKAKRTKEYYRLYGNQR